MTRCPYCGKILHPQERYCWHCELDVSNIRDEEEKPKVNLKARKTLLDDFKDVVKWVKNKLKALRK
ncbi:MAG: hypothetical protein UU24_C0024G0002 [Candidatus Nomurabacteria bacterium GW2011_GWA2_40_9]|uniref:Uncharacterized protein n=1 Tax=Candidatus Nomurabacteria bacterium GW2011_GWA2_40_9 TaxID=1618734 RepID=A0A0G0TVJ7_9BACT|nr:MAG: hypothetical protein UU24_C0024G0002 [Candidatus Nomurabacteria bacterium GW2011_GWA2_40_9]